jgi:uncharacterized protein with HEPN domain
VSRDIRLFLEDIVACCDKIGRYTIGLTFELFCADEQLIDAVARNLEIIGEAAKWVPEQVRSSYPDVHWRKMAGLRDVISHGYFGMDLRLVWDIVQRDVPAVRTKVAAILQTAFPRPPEGDP